ncbi:MAG TPA: phosphate acetyltransferase [Clostridiales bacterium]|nr:phosphate acetyltransferase [Clostridiales bacterium]
MSNDLFIRLEEQARQCPQRIAFPETDNEMILRAAREVADKKIGYPVLIGNEGTITGFAASLGISTEGFIFFDNKDDEVKEQISTKYITEEDAKRAFRRKAKAPVNFAMFLLKFGEVDGVAAGRVYTTADVIIAAQAIVGLEEGFQNISSMGILNVPGFEGPEGQMLAIADCAVNPSPDADGLADIAIASADSVKTLLGWEPRVAMLAFSTCGSAEHESIDVINAAIDLVRRRRPDIKIDGEFQLDSAIIPKVAANKVKRESEVAGKANVLIFPNLHAGNIGVKLIQNFAHGDAYGPILQGFAKPVSDFSRSAPLSEMMGNILMLIIRAQAKNGK